MFPSYDFLGKTYSISPLLFYITLILSFICFYRLNALSNLKKLSLFFIGSFLALFGARLFHILFETQWNFWELPWQAFFEFQGMTIYGSLLFSLPLFPLLLSLLKLTAAERTRFYDSLAPIIGLGVFLMRIHCFAIGCCWGKICPLPWAVTYFDALAKTPLRGIPLHPTQIYHALVGALIFIISITLIKRQRLAGRILPLSLAIYSVGRFLTEFYRGDSYRGEDQFFGLSTSQTISLFVLPISLACFYYLQKKSIYREGTAL